MGCEDFQRGYHGLPIHQFLSSLTDSSAPKYCPPTRVLLLGQGEAEPPKPRAPRKGSRGILAVGLMAPSPLQGSGRPHWHPCSTRNTGKPAPLCDNHPWGYAPEEGTWGGRDPRAEGCGVCSDCSKETEEEIRPRPRRMESVSTTHQDFRAMGFQSTPQPITQVQAVDIPPSACSSLQGGHEAPMSCRACHPPDHILLPLQPHNYLTEQPTSFWLEQARGQPVSPPPPCPASTLGVSAADRDLSNSLLSRVSPASSAETFPSRRMQPSPLPLPCT